MSRENHSQKKRLRRVISLLLTAVLFSGCSHVPTGPSTRPSPGERKIFFLREIAPEQGQSFLSQLGLGTVSVRLARNTVIVTGSAADLQKAHAVLDLVDTKDQFVIETLVPVSAARTIPANDKISEALGDIAIGTFASPPQPGKSARAIIDIQNESVIAVIPIQFHRRLLALVGPGIDGSPQVESHLEVPGQAIDKVAPESVRESTAQTVHEPNEITIPVVKEAESSEAHLTRESPDSSMSNRSLIESNAQIESLSNHDAAIVICPEKPEADAEGAATPELVAKSVDRLQSIRIEQEVTPEVIEPSKTKATYELPPLENGEDILQLDLPERLQMIQLMDLVAEYLGFDYMYDPEKLSGQAVSVRLHGKLQGEVRVNELYPLLESVLKFKGFATTCHKGNLVTIVPVTDALEMDPVLLDSSNTAIEAGDMVVTRIFDLQYVNTTSAMNLLNNMKLSVAASPVEETQALIITCYAHRMARIEQLLSLIDRPGRAKEFRFRSLKYTMAKTLVTTVEALVAELQMTPGETITKNPQPSSPVFTVSAPPRLSSGQKSEEAYRFDVTEKRSVYLDADERTNRILMIGRTEQLAIVDTVIDALDVAQYDPRTLKIYNIMHLNATDAKKKLEELEIIGKSSRTTSEPPPVLVSVPSSTGKADSAEAVARVCVEKPQVTILEAPNSLLVNATDEQQAWIGTVIKHIDVLQQDMRTLKVYEIQHVDAKEVEIKLSEFNLIDRKATDSRESGPTPASASSPSSPTAQVNADEAATMLRPQVSVLESTNSLLINATEFQHTRMANVITLVDTEARQEAIPYETYFLENQDPETLAQVLGKLIQQTSTDKEGKIEQVARKTEEQILIVPDKGTFSLVVYASKKNQDWISKLIKTLDRRRPQVLIDVTLVEIRKTDEFNYDLNLIAGLPDLLETGGQTGSFLVDESATVADKLREPGMRDRFIDFQANSGSGTGFYADKHVNALLTAVQTKNYGRVLAKPKVLVNDNEKGTITTTDTTYVAKTSSIPVSSGAAGTQTNLIQTALDYQGYDAGITLEITPHISEGKLLRLEITLTRSDFGAITRDRPPDLTSSNISTVVTVPDGSTIILGGMLKLNQTKGGNKVPLLGDLPLVGGAFRNISNSDIQNKLYVFVRAEIIRPAEALAGTLEDLERISEQNRAAFEKHEEEFQRYQDWPGIKPKPTDPEKALDSH